MWFALMISSAVLQRVVATMAPCLRFWMLPAADRTATGIMTVCLPCRCPALACSSFGRPSALLLAGSSASPLSCITNHSTNKASNAEHQLPL